MIAPSTDIILYKSNLELDDLNQLKFNTWDDQWRYFSNLPHLYLENATYQRKEGVIRYPTEDIPYDEIIRYNYVSYKKDKGINGLRRLTPKECLRLMGFGDGFNRVVSNTALYMQAGNSIVVDVLIALLKQMDITKYGIDDEK